MTRTEVIDNARRIVQAVNIPVFCDGDTRYGGVQNVRRTVQEFIHAGSPGFISEIKSNPRRPAVSPG